MPHRNKWSDRMKPCPYTVASNSVALHLGSGRQRQRSRRSTMRAPIAMTLNKSRESETTSDHFFACMHRHSIGHNRYITGHAISIHIQISIFPQNPTYNRGHDSSYDSFLRPNRILVSVQYFSISHGVLNLSQRYIERFSRFLASDMTKTQLYRLDTKSFQTVEHIADILREHIPISLPVLGTFYCGDLEGGHLSVWTTFDPTSNCRPPSLFSSLRSLPSLTTNFASSALQRARTHHLRRRKKLMSLR